MYKRKSFIHCSSLYSRTWDSNWSIFLQRCESISRRNWYRLLVEGVLFFAGPTLITGFFYGRIGWVLLHQDRRVSRNRVLTMAFFLSWLFWVILWIPNFILMIYCEKYLKLDGLQASEIQNKPKDPG